MNAKITLQALTVARIRAKAALYNFTIQVVNSLLGFIT